MPQAAERTLRQPAPRSWWPSYWLCHSESFRVESASGGHVGFVEEVVWSADESGIDALVVRVGFDGRRTLVVPAADVVDVRPDASSIVVRTAAP